MFLISSSVDWGFLDAAGVFTAQTAALTATQWDLDTTNGPTWQIS